ncbi:hypothetical protein C8K36_10480 [Rhodococcus sp. OK519]|uniref:hypothetical protein n=1 Tax=Rhodococcus sp. OK519 TaxID=2135729 RepID=UPI000D3A143E|nr:hypothetical protein C8K36_10480 [Rhodococcus sp. OK519]
MDQNSSRAHERRLGAVAHRTRGRRVGLGSVVAMAIAASALVLGAPLPAAATELNAPTPTAANVDPVAEVKTADVAGVDAALPGLGNYPMFLTLKFDVGAGVRVRIYPGDSNCMGQFPTADFVTYDAVTTVPLTLTVRNDSLACYLEPSLQQVRIDVTGGATEVHNSLNFVQMPSPPTGLPNWQVRCGSSSDCSLSRLVPLTLNWISTITARPPQPPTPLGIDCAVTPAALRSTYHQPCVGTGGTAGIPTVLSIVGGRLPNGLELRQGGGAQSFNGIVGSPLEKGSFPITLRARNGLQADATLDVTVVVEPALTYTTLEVAGSSPFRSCVPPAVPGPTCGALFTMRTYSLTGTLDGPTTLSVKRRVGLLNATEFLSTTGPPVTTLLDGGVSEVTMTARVSELPPGSYEAEATYLGGAGTGPSTSSRLPFNWLGSAPTGPNPGSLATGSAGGTGSAFTG